MTDSKDPSAPNQPLLDPAAYVRLHVTPLDAELLNVVLSSTLLPKARNISFHDIQSFPEKRYGFLELPNEDAEKLRKKLNGAVLRGVKIRIDRARPSTIPIPLGDKAMAKEKSAKRAAEAAAQPPKEKTKKRKLNRDEISGVNLEGRTVKRGWTTADEPKEKRTKKDKEKKSKDKKSNEKRKQLKSKYTEHAECLVKTILPTNAAPAPDADPSTPAKRKKGRSREVVVHEFEKTTKFPTFLKAVATAESSKATPQYIDGQGWVDEDGNVVEAVEAKPPRAGKVLLKTDSIPKTRKQIANDESSSSSSEDEAESEESGDESAEEDKPEFAVPAAEDDSPMSDAESENASASSALESEPQRPKSSGSTKSLSITIPPATPSEPKVVHPLEALYKRPKQPEGEAPKSVPEAQGFSFFAGGDEESAEEDDGADVGAQVPLTPYTRHDLELRNIRSAAPTPDTAHPSRRFTPWEQDDDEDDGEPADEDLDEEMGTPSRVGSAQPTDGDNNPASDFQKWFWENRGDLNRSWKKRRKMAGKEKRYRENKARMARAI
ncbi:hypothetical protein N0V88_007766 [Collariella sp. IMI 366227]|nr:hypothetical protein N0V88_007766 [Collariella sp. IMI 366227]